MSVKCPRSVQETKKSKGTSDLPPKTRSHKSISTSSIINTNDRKESTDMKSQTKREEARERAQERRERETQRKNQRKSADIIKGRRGTW